MLFLLGFKCFQKSIQKLIFVRAFCDRGGSATAVDGHTARYTKCSGGGEKGGTRGKKRRGVVCRTIEIDKIKNL